MWGGLKKIASKAASAVGRGMIYISVGLAGTLGSIGFGSNSDHAWEAGAELIGADAPWVDYTSGSPCYDNCTNPGSYPDEGDYPPVPMPPWYVGDFLGDSGGEYINYYASVPQDRLVISLDAYRAALLAADLNPPSMELLPVGLPNLVGPLWMPNNVLRREMLQSERFLYLMPGLHAGAIPANQIPAGITPLGLYIKGAIPANAIPANAIPANLYGLVSAIPANLTRSDLISMGAEENLLPAAIPANLTADDLRSYGLPANAIPANAIPANAIPANAIPANAIPANAIPANIVIIDLNLPVAEFAGSGIYLPPQDLASRTLESAANGSTSEPHDVKAQACDGPCTRSMTLYIFDDPSDHLALGGDWEPHVFAQGDDSYTDCFDLVPISFIGTGWNGVPVFNPTDEGNLDDFFRCMDDVSEGLRVLEELDDAGASDDSEQEGMEVVTLVTPMPEDLEVVTLVTPMCMESLDGASTWLGYTSASNLQMAFILPAGQQYQSDDYALSINRNSDYECGIRDSDPRWLECNGAAVDPRITVDISLVQADSGCEVWSSTATAPCSYGSTYHNPTIYWSGGCCSDGHWCTLSGHSAAGCWNYCP